MVRIAFGRSSIWHHGPVATPAAHLSPERRVAVRAGGHRERYARSARRGVLLLVLSLAVGAQASGSSGAGAGEDIVPLIRWASSGTAAPYTPAQVRANYDLGPLYASGLTGRGMTIGIVDVYGVPTIRTELAKFDAIYDIAAPPSFAVVEPAGRVPAFSSRNSAMAGWADETTLDVEWAHAIAPGAAIVLALTGVDEVEGTSGFAQIVRAERYLIENEHVSVISQSFAATEETFPTVASLMALRNAYVLAARRGVTVLGAAGDWGAASPTSTSGDYYDRRVVNWPASDPLVTAVGGTQIFLGSAGHQVRPPQVWNDNATAVAAPDASGGGVSSDFPRPAWQAGVADLVGKRRGIPDISMDASCKPGVVVYLALPGDARLSGRACGTSLAAPLFAGIVALAGQLAGHSLGLLNPTLYRLGADHAAGLVDITLGNNTVRIPSKGHSVIVTGYRAVTGYDLASGWGTVNAVDLVPELAGRALP